MSSNTTDPFDDFKAKQREGWSTFAPVEFITTAPAGKLVAFSQVKSGDRVLDVGCGTGVVAVTAARLGASVQGLDLTPQLLEKARWNADLARLSIEFREGDVEAMPYKDESFDVVLSQFGHMFAPRPKVALSEMLRVLKRGGRIAFSTWPPELFTGRMFALVSRYLPPPPDVAPPPQWGDIQIIRERMGESVRELAFDRELMVSPCLSPAHFRTFMASVGPVGKLLEKLKDDPKQLKEFQDEFDNLIRSFSDCNTLRQHFLMTRAIKN